MSWAPSCVSSAINCFHESGDEHATTEDTLLAPKSNSEWTRQVKVCAVGSWGVEVVKHCPELFGGVAELIVIDKDESILEQFSGCALTIQVGQRDQIKMKLASDPAEVTSVLCRHQIEQAVLGAKFLIIVASLGGAVGSGASTTVASVARRCGVTTLGIFSTPQAQEGSSRVDRSTHSLLVLHEIVDTYVIIKQESQLHQDVAQRRIDWPKSDASHSPLQKAPRARAPDETTRDLLRTLTLSFSGPGPLNLTLSDGKRLFADSGLSSVECMSLPRAHRASTSSEVLSLLSRDSFLLLREHKNFLVSISGGQGLRLSELLEISSKISSTLVGPSGEVAFAVRVDSAPGGVTSVTVVATGHRLDECDSEEHSEEYSEETSPLYQVRIDSKPIEEVHDHPSPSTAPPVMTNAKSSHSSPKKLLKKKRRYFQLVSLLRATLLGR